LPNSVGQNIPEIPSVGNLPNSVGQNIPEIPSVGNLPNSVGQNIPEIPSVGNLPNTPEDILPPPPDDDIFDDDDEFASEASGDPLKDIQGEFGIAPVNAPEEPVPTGPALASEPDEAPKEKPDPLPAPWLEILREVQETGVPENNITLALQSLLKKVRDKYS
jgi:nitrogen fixation protein